MRIDVVDDIAEAGAAEFDRLDRSAGAAGCHARTAQRQRDGRWRTGYVRCVDGTRLLAFVPFYAPRGATWPDPAYDPRTWGLPQDAVRRADAADCLLVGGHGDLRTGFPVAAQLRSPALLRPVLGALAGVAAAEGRGLALPYVYGWVRDAVTAVCGDAAVWTPLGQDARLPGDVTDPRWTDRLGRRARRNIRADRDLITASRVRVTAGRWNDVEDRAAALIAAHNQRKGRPDHAAFVKMRTRLWDRCPGVEVVAFTARFGAAEGYTTARVWADELDMVEIGLGGEPGPARLAAYLDLLVHTPLRYARDRGLRTIRLGAAARSTKEGRGAVFETQYGGFLDGPATARLAGAAR